MAHMNMMQCGRGNQFYQGMAQAQQRVFMQPGVEAQRGFVQPGMEAHTGGMMHPGMQAQPRMFMTPGMEDGADIVEYENQARHPGPMHGQMPHPEMEEDGFPTRATEESMDYNTGTCAGVKTPESCEGDASSTAYNSSPSPSIFGGDFCAHLSNRSNSPNRAMYAMMRDGSPMRMQSKDAQSMSMQQQQRMSPMYFSGNGQPQPSHGMMMPPVAVPYPAMQPNAQHPLGWYSGTGAGGQPVMMAMNPGGRPMPLQVQVPAGQQMMQPPMMPQDFAMSQMNNGMPPQMEGPQPPFNCQEGPKPQPGFGCQEGRQRSFSCQEGGHPSFGCQEGRQPAFGCQDGRQPPFGCQDGRQPPFGCQDGRQSTPGFPEGPQPAFVSREGPQPAFGCMDGRHPAFVCQEGHQPAYGCPEDARLLQSTGAHNPDCMSHHMAADDDSSAPPHAGPDSRTTLMLRNLPTGFSREMVIDLLDTRGFMPHVDFVYVPMNFWSNLTFGYAFVNLVSHEAAQNCKVDLEGYRAWCVPSDRICEVSWSETQGLDAHLDRYRNSPVMHDTVDDKFKPAFFRDGVRAVFPPPTKMLKPPRTRRLKVGHGAGAY